MPETHIKQTVAICDTQPITADGTPPSRDPTSKLVMTKPALINVSHVFSEFLADEGVGQ